MGRQKWNPCINNHGSNNYDTTPHISRCLWDKAGPLPVLRGAREHFPRTPMTCCVVPIALPFSLLQMDLCPFCCHSRGTASIENHFASKMMTALTGGGYMMGRWISEWYGYEPSPHMPQWPAPCKGLLTPTQRAGWVLLLSPCGLYAKHMYAVYILRAYILTAYILYVSTLCILSVCSVHVYSGYAGRRGQLPHKPQRKNTHPGESILNKAFLAPAPFLFLTPRIFISLVVYLL